MCIRDRISTEEYSLGDNDRLGALIAKYTHADLLVMLSDIDGLYTADPHTHPEATLIHRVESVTPEIEQLGGGSNSGLGTGDVYKRQVPGASARLCRYGHPHRPGRRYLPVCPAVRRRARQCR